MSRPCTSALRASRGLQSLEPFTSCLPHYATRSQCAVRSSTVSQRAFSYASKQTPKTTNGSTWRSRENCGNASRPFSSTSQARAMRTVQEAKSRYRSGPFTGKAGLLFLGTGAGLVVYFQYEKARMERQRIAEATKGIGKPKVGGDFDLVDHHGNKFTSEDMKGKYALVYFGFTHCPDICPEELDKMAIMIDKVKEQCGNVLRPVFITCDPARDTPDVLKQYLEEFHPALLGLTGKYDNVKQVCKAYRVYFSTPPEVQPGQDYLVDHSIYFYLMDPEGDFVEAIGRNFTAPDAAKVIADHVGDWKGKMDKS